MNDFHAVPNVKNILKKKICLPTDPKKYSDVSGNKTFIFFGLINVATVEVVNVAAVEVVNFAVKVSPV